jgi:hypothetical protein
MAKTREVIMDLDYYSALQQHIACGRPLDEPVRDPAWIKEQYLGKAKQPLNLGLDYPHDIAEEKMKMTKIWTSSWKNVQKKDIDTRAVVQKSFNRILNTSTKLSRKERELKRSKSSVDVDAYADVEVIVDKTKSSAFENARPATFNSPRKTAGGGRKKKKLNTGGPDQRTPTAAAPPPGVGLGGGTGTATGGNEPLSAPMDHSGSAQPSSVPPQGGLGFGAKSAYDEARKNLEQMKNKKK